MSDLPNKDELKASGFLDKREAIATISDIANSDDMIENIDNSDNEDDNNIDDFIKNN